VMLEAKGEAQRQLEKIFREMEKQARAILLAEGFPDRKQKHERSLAVRYKGQSFELQIKQTTGNIAAAFHRAHHARYGYAQTQNAVEIVSARVRSSGLVDKTKLHRKNVPSTTAKSGHSVEAYFDRKRVLAAVYERGSLGAGSRLRAPCIVVEYSATALLPANVFAEVDEFENLIITLKDHSG